jgi:ketosteroid isomerase-like protein
MNEPTPGPGPAAMLERLQRATNAHDLEGIVNCFAEGYRNETPAHPQRGFVGQHQVRRNWDQILRMTPDIEMRVLRSVVDESTVWAEIELSGTRPDGTNHSLSGVVIFGEQAGRAAWARFYMEPVETNGAGVDEAIEQHLGSRGAP